VGGREGDAYRSPKQQEAAMRAWAEANGVDVGLLVVEENVSGGKKAQDRKLESLLVRAEEGVSDGVIVYRINRFGRRMRDTVAAVGRLQDAGKRLVSVDDGYDTSQASGQILLGVYAGIAEQQLEERTTNWSTSVTEAVTEGKHIACCAPLGYRRADQIEPEFNPKGKVIRDARLVKEPLAAKVVHAAFVMRSRGDSLGKIAAYMGDELGRRLARTSVRAILSNRAYLGEARGPNNTVKPDAHEAVVDLDLYESAHKVKGRYHPRNGSMAAQSLLAGIVHCAGCGHRMQVTGRNDRHGVRRPMYVCQFPDCAAKAIIDAPRMDAYAIQLAEGDAGGLAAGLSSGEERYIAARADPRTAEAELRRFEDPGLSTELGPDVWRRGLKRASDKVNEARIRVWDLQDYSLPEDGEDIVLMDDGTKIIAPNWGIDPVSDRRVLRRCIESLTVAKCDRRRGWQAPRRAGDAHLGRRVPSRATTRGRIESAHGADPYLLPHHPHRQVGEVLRSARLPGGRPPADQRRGRQRLHEPARRRRHAAPGADPQLRR
jgi:DNA invertase Pin-like site-specific DNA recombinase